MRVRVADLTVLPAGIVKLVHLRSAYVSFPDPSSPSARRVVAAPWLLVGVPWSRSVSWVPEYEEEGNTPS